MLNRLTKRSVLSVYLGSLFYLGIATLGGCAAPELNQETGILKLNQGSPTDRHPEVGHLDLQGVSCTGTLVAPSTLITAAHCVSFRTQRANFGVFTLSGLQREVDAAISLSTSAGIEDIALLHLSEPIINSLVIPAQLAIREPARGSRMTIYGFGCQDRETLGGGGYKQSVSFNYGDQTRELCPGDSGGPVFDELSSNLILLNSAYHALGGDDIFAAPFIFYEEIELSIERLERGGLITDATDSVGASSAITPTDAPASEGDSCAEFGYYNDDFCDTHCDRPDPDCEVN